MEKSYLVPVLIKVRVEGDDYKDAANIAEQAIKIAIMDEADPPETEREGKPAIVFSHGYTYKVVVEGTPTELNRSMRNGTGPLFLYGKVGE